MNINKQIQNTSLQKGKYGQTSNSRVKKTSQIKQNTNIKKNKTKPQEIVPTTNHIKRMNDPLNEDNGDLAGLVNDFISEDIDNVLKQQYIENEKEIKSKVVKRPTTSKMRVQPKIEIIVDKSKTLFDDSNIKKEDNKLIESKSNQIDLGIQEDAQYDILKEGEKENIYETIFKKMIKEKELKKNYIPPKDVISSITKNDIASHKEESQHLIKDDLSIQRFDDIDGNAYKKNEDLQYAINNEKIPETIFTQPKTDISQVINLNDKPIMDIPLNEDELMQSTNTKKDITEKEQMSTINRNMNVNVNLNTLSTSKEKIEDKNEIKQTENEKEKEENQINIYDRLNSFLDQSEHNQYQPQQNKTILNDSTINNNHNHNSFHKSSKIDNYEAHSENITLNLELKEAKKSIELMTSVINDLKKQLKEKDSYLTQALSAQKSENEIALNRQNTLIETMYSEKKKLENQISDLKDKLNQSEKVSYKKLQTMRENYELETKKNKDAWFQAEKLRRKKWEEQKIKEIKEITAKGLEPEIEKIISTHKNEITNLENQFLKELKTEKDKIINEYEQKVSEIKKKLTFEKEEAIEHEKNLAVQRLRNQSERFEDEITEERRRWNTKMQNELSRLESLRDKDKKIYEDQISKLEERNNSNIFSNENYYQRKIEDIRKDYEQKMKEESDNIKATLKKENDLYIEEKENELNKKFKEMKLELLKDRDKQINIVIEKLGEETLQEKKKHLIECEKKANEKNIFLNEENSLLKKRLNDLSEKLTAETKNRLTLEDNIGELTKKINQKEEEIKQKNYEIKEITNHYNELSDKFKGISLEFNKEKMNIEIEMKSNIQKNEAEINILNHKIKSLQSNLEEQKKNLEMAHRKEIEEIEKKIKKSFQRKDAIIAKLQEESEMKDLTIRKYEELLNQQRQELFGQ